MSRGPGRLQRAILAAMPDAETTTSNICHALCDEWWWDETFDRQVRRALDSLHRRGLVEKRLIPNPQYRHASVALWRITGPAPTMPD